MRRVPVAVLTAGSVCVAGVFVAIALLSERPLTDSALFATALGPLIVVGSAALIVRQVDEAANTVRAQLFDATAGRIFDLNHLFIESPDLRPYFYGGRDVEGLTQVQRDKVAAVAEMHIDFFDTEMLRQKQFNKSLGDLPTFGPWIRGLLRTSPAICRRLAEDAGLGREGWYGDIVSEYQAAAERGDVAWPAAQALDSGNAPA